MQCIPISIGHKQLLIEKCFTAAHCEHLMSRADLNVFPQFHPKTVVLERKKKDHFPKLWSCCPGLFYYQWDHPADNWLAVYFLRSSSQQKAGAGWGHYCCLLPVCPFFALQRWFWSFAFLAAFQKAVNLIEAAAGKQNRQGNTCRVQSLPLKGFKWCSLHILLLLLLMMIIIRRRRRRRGMQC